MARGKRQAAEEADHEGLHRTCHLCEKEVESRVWYARNKEERTRKTERVHRVYACPSCYFELDEDERNEYYRERV